MLGDFPFNLSEEQRLTRPRLSIPGLAMALAGSGQAPRSQPFYAALPDDVRRLFLQAYSQYGGGFAGSPFGQEYNLAPAQSILGSSAYQQADQPTQGHILDLVQSITSAQAPGLTQSLSAPSTPTAPPPTPQPSPAPSPAPPPAPTPQPPDPYAPWGGYDGYLRWLYGLDSRGAEGGSGGDVGADGGGGGGNGGGGGGAL